MGAASRALAPTATRGVLRSLFPLVLYFWVIINDFDWGHGHIYDLQTVYNSSYVFYD